MPSFPPHAPSRSRRGTSPLAVFALALAGLAIGPGQASAALTSIYSVTGPAVDTPFEGLGGWLQTTYNLPAITTPTGTTQNTVLPQLERGVGQIASNNANGLFVPTSGTGIPGQPNPPSGSDGVWQALTNVPVPTTPVTVGTNPANFTSAADTFTRTFTYSLSNGVVSYQIANGTDTRTWTSPQHSYLDEINTIEFRIRSTAINSITITDLLFSDTITTNQSLADISASSGNVTLAVLSGSVGDFTLTGSFNYTGEGSWNHQLKGLSIIPEPASAAMLLAATGVLLTRRRRQALIG